MYWIVIVSCVQSYFDAWGEKADIAKATYWIGKTQIQQKLITEAIDTYIGVVLEYGDDVLEPISKKAGNFYLLRD